MKGDERTTSPDSNPGTEPDVNDDTNNDDKPDEGGPGDDKPDDNQPGDDNSGTDQPDDVKKPDDKPKPPSEFIPKTLEDCFTLTQVCVLVGGSVLTWIISVVLICLT